ncbi:hypothetical protein FRC12_000090 [Ceratobasidium sp. 428]|nr:hypothetical protein FRC12_000090 [Ceratobasidium sp. 428]
MLDDIVASEVGRSRPLYPKAYTPPRSTPSSTHSPSRQYSYYAPATPATTPTKSHPGSSYPYRQVFNPSHTQLASAPPQASSSRAPPVRAALVPTARLLTSSAPVPAPRSTNPLPAAPEAYSHSRKGSVSRPSRSQPPSNAYHAATRRTSDTKPTKGKSLSSSLTFYDIPWPVLGTASSLHDLTSKNTSAFLLSPHHSQKKSRRTRLCAAILIWHLNTPC